MGKNKKVRTLRTDKSMEKDTKHKRKPSKVSSPRIMRPSMRIDEQLQ